MKARFLALVIVLGLMCLPVSADTEVLFDNGPVVEQDLGLRDNNGTSSIYDDFTLTSDSIVTGFAWSQFDENVTYSNSILTIFNGLPKPSTRIAQFVVVAQRTSNGLSLLTNKTNSGQVAGFDLIVDGLSVSLSAGTYFLGIWNNVTGGNTLIANTFGTSDTTVGFFQHNQGGPLLFGLTESGPEQFNNANAAFVVFGKPVPEPATLSLLAAGLLVGAAFRKRFKRLG